MVHSHSFKGKAAAAFVALTAILASSCERSTSTASQNGLVTDPITQNPTPTVTVTMTPSPQPTVTVTMTPSPSPSPSPTVTVSPSPIPTDAFAEFRQLIQTAQNVPGQLNGYVVARRDLRYGQDMTSACPSGAYCIQGFPDDPEQVLDIYYPSVVNTVPMKTILFVHQGGWKSGSKNGYDTECQNGTGYNLSKCQCPVAVFASRGYAVACMNYHKTTGANPVQFPGQVIDVKTAVRYLRRNAGALGVDVNRIAVWGVAAGAHMATMVGNTPVASGVTYPLNFEGSLHSGFSSKVQAVIDYSGFTDLTLPTNQEVIDSINLYLGYARESRPTDTARANPISYVSFRSAPTYMIHGDGDYVIPIQSSSKLKTALVNNNVSVEAWAQPMLNCAQAAYYTSDQKQPAECATNSSTLFPVLSNHSLYYTSTAFDRVHSFLTRILQ